MNVYYLKNKETLKRGLTAVKYVINLTKIIYITIIIVSATIQIGSVRAPKHVRALHSKL